MEVDADLYDFLKENETGLYTQEFHKNKTVFAYVHVDFFKLEEFAEIVGDYHFEEGGIEVRMFKNSICVEINNMIDSVGHNLSSYKNCFHKFDWDRCKDEIKEMESR